jgi:Fe(3+) dicitrate transport protein
MIATRFLAVALSGAAMSSMQAQQTTGAIEGRVIDVNGIPLPGVRVFVIDGPQTVRIARDGTFRIDSVRVGPQRVVAGTDTARVTVEQTRVARVELRLPSVLSDRLGPMIIRAYAIPGSVQPASDVKNAMILAGAKSEVIMLAGADANVAEKVPRQIFAKVPGIFVYDMDGTGNQINVSTRGLDPHRSWELNVRQDGVLLNSDLYGYPASHYSPPMEAIERIELVRGTAALQYGSQFGGLIDYITKTGGDTRPLNVESVNTVGSFGLFSTYNAIGGSAGRVSYYAYVSKRNEDGYRRISSSDASAQFASLTAHLTPALDVRAQVGRSMYKYRIPGPLTDSMFRLDPRMNTRSRNWFNPDIIVPALTADWHPDTATRLLVRLSGVFGARNSVQFVGFATAADAADPRTGQLGPRQVDIDNFNSKTAELRMTRVYGLGSMSSTLATGLAFSWNDLRRRQQGRGTTGEGLDLTLSSGAFGRDLHYRTTAVAAYLENAFLITPKFSVIPGARIEHGRTQMDGYLAYYDPTNTPRRIDHDFPLFGIRAEYKTSPRNEWYGGWSQAYRPMILKDVLPENALERTDPNLDDARGWTIEAGTRGSLMRGASYDVNLFGMRYDNRFGTLAQSDAQGSYLFKTNVGSTWTTGVEARIEAPVVTRASFSLNAFSSSAWFHARYRDGTVVSAGKNVNIVGNQVEAVPELITRNGVTARSGRWSGTALVSYTSSSFADPLNTIVPVTNGAVGKVPAYTVVDANTSYTFSHVRLHAGVSNLFDRSYFTKRPTFYPGPGVWPSDGRTFQLSTTLRF